MKTLVTLALVFACIGLTGCGTFGSKKVWTYNLQQSLCRSGGDVAMTMILDQGVNKDEAVALCNALIKFLESDPTATVISFKLQVNAFVEKNPSFANFVNRLFLVIPSDVGDYVQIPSQVKSSLLSFLKDGAVYGAGLYKSQAMGIGHVKAYDLGIEEMK